MSEEKQDLWGKKGDCDCEGSRVNACDGEQEEDESKGCKRRLLASFGLEQKLMSLTSCLGGHGDGYGGPGEVGSE
jgi:hypothetical protein